MMSVDETLMCSFQILKPARNMLSGGTNTKSGFKVRIINIIYLYPLKISDHFLKLVFLI
jgi:serine/threonine-protein phosphatase PP1 catalytic subunit